MHTGGGKEGTCIQAGEEGGYMHTGGGKKEGTCIQARGRRRVHAYRWGEEGGYMF